jgi:CubicO group peptidase (beta-lactamase class C family)
MSDARKHVQQQVQDAIDHLVASGAERGLQVAVYRRGELVVDAVAGAADPATGRAVSADTLFYSASVAKGVASTVAHVLVERGAFSYDTPVVALWPAFGAHGKEGVTVRHVLTHSAGVPGMPADLTPEDLGDWQKICALIAGATPWWEPGTRTGYHALSYGYLIGEIIRRATGKPICQVLREEVAGPLGVAGELFFGVPRSALGRVARLEEAEGSAEMLASVPDDLPVFKAAPRAIQPTAAFANRTDVLTADIPAGGTMSARAVARMYAALLGEVGGTRLVEPVRLREITTVAISGEDQVLGIPAARGLGYDIGFFGPLNSPTLFGMAGGGGTAAYADTASGIAIALTKNRVTYGQFAAFNQVGEIVTKAPGES